MRRHWQKKPLLVRQAVPDACGPSSSRAELFALAAGEERRIAPHRARRQGWSLRHGPVRAPRAAVARPGANGRLLVQGLDLHVDAPHELLERFRFVPDARLDDVMVSYATDGGGVGPHFDSYDVFLLQVHGPPPLAHRPRCRGPSCSPACR